MQILAPGEPLQSVITPELKGTFDVVAALEMMLKGTDLTVSRTAEGIIAISLKKKNCNDEGETMLSNPKNTVSVIALLFGALSTPACLAQDTPSTSSNSGSVETVVVTGTLIRGVAPVGSDVVKLSTEDIQVRGVTSTIDLLAQVPMVSQFGSLPTSAGNAASVVIPPTIRGLPTLVLFNGYRAASTGIVQQVADIDIIPPVLLDRVEVIPGSGSALYGSDAVGGVINFITRTHVDGVEVNGQVGAGDHYTSWSTSTAFGYDWAHGGFVAAYQYSWNSNLSGANRDWYTIDPRNLRSVPPRVMTCDPGNIVANGVNYTLPNFTQGTNSCDTYKMNDIYPEQNRHNVYASAHQDITSSLEFEVVGFWSRLEQNSQGLSAFAFTDTEATGTITSTNPYFHAIGTEKSQTFSESLASVARTLGYRTGLNDDILEQYGFTPKLTYSFGNDWRAVLSFNYGRTSNNTYSGEPNTITLATALAGTTTATAFDPYDPGATDPSVLKSILDFGALGLSHQQLAEVRLVTDGSLFALPGGEVKMAAGFELHEDSVVTSLGDTTQNPLPTAHGDRKIESVFGELMIPVVGDGNAMTFVKDLDLSVSGRYDHYSDVGDTFNPKVGMSYSPISDLKLRANWGKSFHAPALTDTKASVGSGANVLPFSVVYRAGDLAYALRPEIFIVGGNPGLKPEKSQSWSMGADLAPSNIPGLSLSGTYFAVNFKDQLTQPPWSNANSPAAQPYITFFPTLAQVLAATAGLRSNVPDMNSLFNPPGNEPYAIIDARLANLSRVNTSGLDFEANYTTPTSFGSIHLGVGGTYYLTYNTKADTVSAFVNHLEGGIPRIRLQATTGFTAGDLTGEIRLDYLGGNPVQNDSNQRYVSAYTPVSVYFAYALPDWVFFKQSRLTLNVDNLFDEDPPWTDGAPGVAFTNLGRVVKFGLHTSL